MTDDLLIKYFLGAASPDESATVKHWLAADEHNETRLRQFRAVWEMSGRTAVAAPDTREALTRLRERMSRMGESEGSIRVRRKIIWVYRGMAAAVLVALVGVGIVRYFRPLRLPSPSSPPSVTAARVGVTILREGRDTLPDGSVVTLARHAKIMYKPGLEGPGRAISMEEGEASFSVVRDPARPFVVLAGNLVVKVLGTSFLIRNGPDSTEVMVATGVVQVSRDNDSVILHAGQRLIAFEKKAGMVVRDGESGSSVDMKRGETQRKPGAATKYGPRVKVSAKVKDGVRKKEPRGVKKLY